MSSSTSAATPAKEWADPVDQPVSGEELHTPAERTFKSTKKPLQFWLVFLGACISLFLSALELTSVSTALPTIVHDLEGEDFIWVGSAYSIASAAFMPTSGGLANIFGRRSVMMASIFLFAAGSAIAGAAQSMNMLIAARALQGTGGGGVMALTEIIVADLVPLRERGNFGGLLGVVWALASVLGPPVGGALATAGQWRWLFYLNIPLSGLAATLVFFFLRLRTPTGTLREKIGRIDRIGNGIIIASTTSVILALTWGGVQYQWTSYRVLTPLIVGGCGIVGFVLYEFYVAKDPVLPKRIVDNRTTFSGMAGTFLMGMSVTMVTYYLPTYFQGAQGASPIRSGVLIFVTACTLAPFAIITGQSVEKTGHYLVQNYIGWGITMIGYGTMSLLKADSSLSKTQGLQLLGAVGLGILQVGPLFGILAPLKVEDNALALALSAYVRTFGLTFGITVGTTILQNGLVSKLPPAFLASFPQGAEISYSIIPIIKTLSEPLKTQVQEAFADSISNVWIAIVIIGGVAIVATLPMKQITLHTHVDETWGLETKEEMAQREGVV